MYYVNTLTWFAADDRVETVIVNRRLRRCLYLVVFYGAGLVADLAMKGGIFLFITVYD